MRYVPPGTYSIPSSAGASDDRARSDSDFASTKLILNSGGVSSGLEPFHCPRVGSPAMRIRQKRRRAIHLSCSAEPLLIAGWRQPQLFQRLLDRERTGSLARWELYEARQMLSHDRLRRDDHERVLDEPPHVVAGFVLCPLERVRAQIKQHGKPQLHHWLLPYTEAFGLLFEEHRFPLIITKASQVAVVGPVEELAAFVWPLATKKVTLVIPVEA